MKDEVSFHVAFKKMTPNYIEKEVSSHYEEEEAPVEFVSNVEEYLHSFIKQLK